MLFICGVLNNPAFATLALNQQNATQLVKNQDKQKPAPQKIMPTSEVVKKKPNAPFTQDPTRPPSIVVAQIASELDIAPDFELTAIFTRNQQQYAVVNGTIVTKGDRVADMYVTDISASTLSMLDTDSSKQMMVLELNGASQVKTQVNK